jgi:DNA-binding NarL/FixJ family response regulator
MNTCDQGFPSAVFRVFLPLFRFLLKDSLSLPRIFVIKCQIMDKKTNIIIVDDNPEFLTSLSSLLKKHPGFSIIGRFNSGQELLDGGQMHYADLILMDIEMPGLNGIQTARLVNFRNSRVKLIAITMYQDKVYLDQLVEAGFRGCINKSDVADNLFQVIETVLQERFIYPDNLRIANLPDYTE